MNNKNNNLERISRGQIPLYLTKMHNGDITARNKLIEHYTNNIVKYIEKNYSNVCCPKEDLIQSSVLAIVKVIDNCKTDDINFLNRKINYNIKTAIEKQIKIFKDHNVSFKKTCYTDINYQNIENNDLLYRAIEKLPKKKKMIIKLYYFENHSLKEIANMYNLPNHQYIHQLLNEALTFIKQDILFNSIDFKSNYNILKLMNMYLKQCYTNDEEKIELFDEYASSLPEKNKKILYFHFYGNFSVSKISNIFDIDEKEIKEIINNFIAYFKFKVNRRKEINKALNVDYNPLLNALYDDLIQYSESDIITALQQLLIYDKILLDRWLHNSTIEREAKLRDIIISKIKNILKEEKKKKIVKIKN